LKINFKYKSEDENIKKVHLVGSFNNWNKSDIPMKYNLKNKSWETFLNLSPGDYLYKFLLNGEDWIHDPYGERFVQNDVGTLDSIKLVKPKSLYHGRFEPVAPSINDIITFYSPRKASLLWSINGFNRYIMLKTNMCPMEKIEGKRLYKCSLGPFNKGELPDVICYNYMYPDGSLDDNNGRGYWLPIDLKIGGNTFDFRLKSKSLGYSTPFRLYLPAGYFENNDRKFPLMLLIHGYGGTCKSDWTQQNIIRKMADKFGIILVWPDGNFIIDKGIIPSWYINSPKIKNARMEDYIIKELIPFIEKKFRVKKDKASRAIGGISMGGFGAFYLASRYNDYFGVACSMSAIYNLHQYKDIDALKYLVGRGSWSKSCFDVLKLARKSRDCAYYFIVGRDEEGAFHDNLKLNDILECKKISHEFHIYPGNHTNNFWRLHIQEMMEFAGGHLCL
jgi:S-formylglutathione hydrolase FrmB